jgi:hypothetical protein
MKKYFFTLFLLGFVKLSAQNMSAFVDNRGYFTIFDNGNVSTIEYNAPQSFQVGGNSVAYIDFNSTFKIYYNGEVTTLYNGPVNKYFCTHNIVVYNIAGQIYVFDRGKVRALSSNTGDYAVADSLVAYIDNTFNAFYVYYDHDRFTLENNLAINPLVNFAASNNTLAYINGNNEFKIFWNGGSVKVAQLSPGYTVDYQTGSDIVAFLAGTNNSLNAYYKGNFYTISNIPVKTYKAADDMVVYEDQNGLHAFSGGKNYDLVSSYSITYNVSDSMLVFYTPGYFRVFNRGKTTILENYMPDEYAIDNNTLVYVNQQGGLKVFYNGETYDLTMFDRVQFKLEGNALWYKSQTMPNKFFLKGKKY